MGILILSAPLLGGMLFRRGGYIESVSLASLGEGIFFTNVTNTISGTPSALATVATLIIRFSWSAGMATVIIDCEGTNGIYTRRLDSGNFQKQ